MKKSVRVGMAAGLAALVATTVGGCAGSAVNVAMGNHEQAIPDEIVIGALHPLSGSNAVDGQQMRNAARMAVDAVNAAGGIASLGGADLVLEAADTQGAPEVGQSEATRLVQEGAVALVGSFQSATSANIAAVAERNHVPFVMDVSALDSILQQGYNYSFRIQPDATMMGAQGLSDLVAMGDAAGTKVEKVAFLYEQGNYGTAAFKEFDRRAREAGITVDPAISYDASSVSDMTTQIQRAAAGDADVLAVVGYYRDSLLVSQALDIVKPDFDAVFGVANGGFDQASFVQDAPDGAEGYFDSNYHWDVTDPAAQQLAADYQQQFGEPIRSSAVLTYDAVMLVAKAIDEAGSVDPERVRDAIASSTYDPLVVNDGPVSFDEAGQNTTASTVVMQVQNGSVKQVFPNELAEAPFTYPLRTEENR